MGQEQSSSVSSFVLALRKRPRAHSLTFFLSFSHPQAPQGLWIRDFWILWDHEIRLQASKENKGENSESEIISCPARNAIFSYYSRRQRRNTRRMDERMNGNQSDSDPCIQNQDVRHLIKTGRTWFTGRIVEWIVSTSCRYMESFQRSRPSIVPVSSESEMPISMLWKSYVCHGPFDLENLYLARIRGGHQVRPIGSKSFPIWR